MGFNTVEVPQSGLMAERINELKKYCVSKLHQSPDFYVKAPGRVNIIGEHIDYCGYAVFPLAIAQNVLLAAVKRSDTLISVANVDSRYESFEANINEFVIEGIEHQWFKYVLCGIQGIKDFGGSSVSLPGMTLVVSGNIPPGAGLSSSSALVCAVALAAAHMTNLQISLHELAELCARCERYIGTQGGGMDQAACLLSSAGSAQLIEFNPLRCTSVTLPEGTTFMVANSLAEKNKATDGEYNTRVTECRLACRLLAIRSNVAVKKNMQFGELQNSLNLSFSEMVELVKRFLHPQPYSKQELSQLFNIPVSQLEKELLIENTKHLPEFNLHKRALHVFTEASRVWEFRAICDDWSSRARFSGDEEKSKVIQQLGKLIEESHLSAQLLYECSHPQLDKLVKISQKVAYGARLTGAGWGGCIIALVDKQKVDEYRDLVTKEYYVNEGYDNISDWSAVLFSTKPSSGAEIFSTQILADSEHRQCHLIG